MSFVPENKPPVPATIALAITAYLHEMREMGRESKTVQWHQLSLAALQQYLWDQFQLTEVHQLSGEVLKHWIAYLHTVRSPRTGAALAVNTIAAYARPGGRFATGWCARDGCQRRLCPKGRFLKGSGVFPSR